MKKFLPNFRGSKKRILLLGVILFFLSANSFGQITYLGSSSNPADNGTSAATTVAVVPVASMQTGDLVVMVSNSRVSTNTHAISATGGQAWNTLAAINTTNSTGRIFWCTFNGTWTANPSVSFSTGTATGVVMHVYRPTVTTNIWGVDVAQQTATYTNASASITRAGQTTVHNSTVTLASWFSIDDNTWGTPTAGWTTPGSAQYRISASNSSTYAHVIKTAAGATGSVTKTQTANGPDAGQTAIISFYEYAPASPANDDCLSAVTLTPDVTCSTFTGNLQYATSSAPAGSCGGATAATTFGAWYSFVATTTTHIINVGSLGGNLSAATTYVEAFSGSCGALTSLACQNASTAEVLSGLTVGNTYYVRVYVTSFPNNPTTANWNFNICVQQPPANDECTGATMIVGTSYCSTGTFLNSTPNTSGLPTCGGSGAYPEVWYSFIARSNRPTITLSGLGSNLNAANTYMQLYSGLCGALTPLACSVSPLSTALTPGGVGLTINSTYYIRVIANNFTTVPTSGNLGFTICFTDPTDAVVDFAKSYVNITDGTSGGTIDPGDVLEIRSVLVVQAPGGNGTLVGIDNVSFTDTLKANKGYRLLKDSMALRTNEGYLFRPSATTYFTDASTDADAGWITTLGAGTDTTLQMNMGELASRTVAGKIRSTSRPSNFGNTCIIMATYRVRVTAAYGTKIKYGGGSFRYRDTATLISYVINFPSDSLIVYSSPGSCPDAISPTNVIGDEFNGTFGVQATGTATPLQNRTTSANTNYAYALFSTPAGNGPGDYYYGITNNTSGTGSIVQTDPKPTGTNRVFSVWDITGDHTNATNTGNTSKGNLPCDLTKPVSATNPCGYMMVVNSAYRSDVAFQYNFSGACTETYYEISAWMKNICSKCGCDSFGTGSTGATYHPAKIGDSSGVRPNVAFQINGIDYYTSGDIIHQGLTATQTGSDTANRWVKRSFVYKTKPNETSFKMTFRNNAPGGGGNDWAIDDISIRTCYPKMAYSPITAPNACANTPLTLTDTVTSYYDTYVNYKWQRSTDGGTTWVDIAGTTVTGAPSTQVIATYTIPAAFTTSANSGDKYRVVVATNLLNLANGCGFSDPTPITISITQPSSAPTGISGANICNGSSTLLTASGGTLGTNATYQWGTGSLVGTNPIAGATSSTYTPSPIVTTTYWVRIENTKSPCPTTTSGLTITIIVKQPSVAATSAKASKNNVCPGNPVVLSVVGGSLGTNAVWNWYTGSCGGTLVGTGASITVNPTVATTYYVRAEGDCNVTTCVSVSITISCNIDKDKDGIPDWVESNFPAAFLDANGNGILDAYDAALPGYVDNNGDFINDNFQADGDIDGDGILNYLDTDFPGRVDTNGDGIDDRFDADLDGRINMLDLDSDNDGIPDVVEAFGVDANGDGLIDNYTDTDGDGLSQNVDANNTGAYNSGAGLGRVDFDNDNVPNEFDLDSDNDGIPDLLEAGGVDANNNGKVDVATDTSPLDGWADVYEGSTKALLKTGADTNGDGRADSYTMQNMDADAKPNPYDMDSDGDGIVDVIEAGFSDTNYDGVIDGAIGTNGWSTVVSGMTAPLAIRNTDSDVKPDYLDIDSDNDGITDNIEGQTTFGYILPTAADNDGDGLADVYDNVVGFGGGGIHPVDTDGDAIPDYRDLNSDGDSQSDAIEGNDFNFNTFPDDNVTLTNVDTDGDGLDDRFDADNTSANGTSAYMGALGSFSGPSSPGTRSVVQRSWPTETNRDWRFVGTVLPVDFLNFGGLWQANAVPLNWKVIAQKDVDHFEIERSVDNTTYTQVGKVSDKVTLNVEQTFKFTDDVSAINKEVIYYRLKVIGKAGDIKYSNVLVVRRAQTKTPVNIMPNPASDYVSVKFFAEKDSQVSLRLIDNVGKTVFVDTRTISKGLNLLQINNLRKYSNGIYTLQITVNDEVVNQKLVLVK